MTRGAGAPSSTEGGRYGFTLIELMVSVALLVAVILMVAQIFDISSNAASRTNAQSEVFSAAAAFRERITMDISRMQPGLLIIESPPATPIRAETPNGEVVFRLRQDRLLFVAGGAPGQYESLTDPTRGEPDANFTPPAATSAFQLRPSQWAPTATPSALMYYGPSEPMDASGNPRRLDLLGDPRPPSASEWVFVNRALLIGSEPNTGIGYFGATLNPTPAWWPQFDAWRNSVSADWSNFFSTLSPPATALTVPANYLNGSIDVLYPVAVAPPPANSTPMTAEEFIDRLNAKLPLDDGSGQPASRIEGLLQPGRAPMTASLRDPTAFDYYTRNGANFMPRMADIRIEWTDGRSETPPPPYNTNPDLRTRWFGLVCDTGNSPDPTNPGGLNNLNFTARRRADVVGNTYYAVPASTPAALFNAYNTETAVFNNQVEWAAVSSANAQYRAVWRKDNWQHRPKALRITYRLFDAGNKLQSDSTVDLDDDDLADPEGGGQPYVLSRYGQEFSVIVPVP